MLIPSINPLTHYSNLFIFTKKNLSIILISLCFWNSKLHREMHTNHKGCWNLSRTHERCSWALKWWSMSISLLSYICISVFPHYPTFITPIHLSNSFLWGLSFGKFRLCTGFNNELWYVQVCDVSRSGDLCCKNCSEPVIGTCMDFYGLFPIFYHQKDSMLVMPINYDISFSLGA